MEKGEKEDGTLTERETCTHLAKMGSRGEELMEALVDARTTRCSEQKKARQCLKRYECCIHGAFSASRLWAEGKRQGGRRQQQTSKM
jgi:hypothetical protein